MNGIDIARELREGGITTRTVLAAFFAGSLAALAGTIGILPYRIYAGLPLDGKLLLWFFVYSVILFFAFRFWQERGRMRRDKEP